MRGPYHAAYWIYGMAVAFAGIMGWAWWGVATDPGQSSPVANYALVLFWLLPLSAALYLSSLRLEVGYEVLRFRMGWKWTKVERAQVKEYLRYMRWGSAVRLYLYDGKYVDVPSTYLFQDDGYALQDIQKFLGGIPENEKDSGNASPSTFPWLVVVIGALLIASLFVFLTPARGIGPLLVGCMGLLFIFTFVGSIWSVNLHYQVKGRVLEKRSAFGNRKIPFEDIYSACEMVHTDENGGETYYLEVLHTKGREHIPESHVNYERLMRQLMGRNR